MILLVAVDMAAKDRIGPYNTNFMNVCHKKTLNLSQSSFVPPVDISYMNLYIKQPIVTFALSCNVSDRPIVAFVL